jgi:hypothetical protein
VTECHRPPWNEHAISADLLDFWVWHFGCARSCIWNDLHLVSASRRSSAPSTSSLWKPAAPRRSPRRQGHLPFRPGAGPPLGRHQATLAVVNVTTIGLVT